MPTYVYECSRCGELEVDQSITAPPLERCPQCGLPVKRLIAGGTSFVLKGGGGPRTHCDREAPCCGRATRCDKPPCSG